MRHAIGCGEAEEYLAAPMADKAAQSRESHTAAPDDAREQLCLKGADKVEF